MEHIKVSNQKEWDALPKKFSKYTEIDISLCLKLVINFTHLNCFLVARDSSQPYVVARDSSQPHVVARDRSQPHVEARDSSQPYVVARDSSQPYVEAWGSSQLHVEARDRSQPHVEAWDRSQPYVEARDSSKLHVEARDSSKPYVEAWGSSQLHVEAWDRSQPYVVARDSSQLHVEAWDRSQPYVVARDRSQPYVVAWDRSQPHVEAWDRSQPYVVARDRSQPYVVARDSSQPHVEAWDSSQPHVEAWDRSQPHVEARDSSQPHVEARGSSQVMGVNIFTKCLIQLFGYSVLTILADAKIKVEKKSKTCHVQKVKPMDWFENNGVEKKKNIILYKRVSKDFKTQEKTENETTWTVGTTLEHPAWNPGQDECGKGKFHACSRPYFCDEFRSETGDKYIALAIALVDTHAWPNPQYPHKIAFRKGKVLYECDRFGKEIKPLAK